MQGAIIPQGTHQMVPNDRQDLDRGRALCGRSNSFAIDIRRCQSKETSAQDPGICASMVSPPRNAVSHRRVGTDDPFGLVTGRCTLNGKVPNPEIVNSGQGSARNRHLGMAQKKVAGHVLASYNRVDIRATQSGIDQVEKERRAEQQTH